VYRCMFITNDHHVLSKLPKSLHDTYILVLEISEENREDASCLSQCLTVTMRLLYVKELVEVLAVEFDCASGIPKLKPDRRWEDQGAL
jgi:hypothetical protein